MPNDLLARNERKAQREAQKTARRNAALPPTPAPPPTPVDPNAPTAQETALNAFYNTPYYQFPLEQGLQAINASYAGRGLLESGAAQKAINDYAAGQASGGLMGYTGLLQGQQSLGATAASSAAGVGANYGSSITGLNNNYANALSGLNSGYAANVGNINNSLANANSTAATNIAGIQSNAAIARANNTNAMLGGIGSAIGYGLGGVTYGGGSTYYGFGNA